MKARRFLAALALIGLAHAAHAASVPLVNPQQLQIPATGGDFNAVIASINAILSPLTGYASAPVNLFALNPANTGSLAIIGLQSGGDTNAGIGISPNGSGAIVLFAGGSVDTGVLQFGNQTSFIPANGLGICPGIAAGKAPLGVGNTITGFVPILDWMGRPHAFPVC